MNESQNWLTLVGEVSQETWNQVKAIGPFLISQSDRMSEAFQRHQGRMAESTALKEFLSGEVALRGELRRKLWTKYIDATDEERVRLQRDLESLDGEVRRLGIGAKSLEYPEANTDGEAGANRVPPGEKPAHELQDHWIDRFNELARLRNEPWRAELLARALSSESANPGSISARALWSIGTIEERVFLAFSKFLDLCFWPAGGSDPFLPDGGDSDLEKRPVLSIDDTPVFLGQITFLLKSAELLSDPLTSSKQLDAGQGMALRCGDDVFIVTAKEMFSYGGLILSTIGQSLARFHEPKWSPEVLPRLERWTTSLSANKSLSVHRAKVSDLRIIGGRIAVSHADKWPNV